MYDALELTDNGAALSAPDRTQFTSTIFVHGSTPLGISVSGDSPDYDIVIGVFGLAAEQTAIQLGDHVLSYSNIHKVRHYTSCYLVPIKGAVSVDIQLTRRATTERSDFVYKIASRRVCKHIFQHRYPVSCPTLERICFAKKQDARTVYALRLSQPGLGDSTRGIRGQVCASWWEKYVEHNSERLPDVAIRLLPCLSLMVRSSGCMSSERNLQPYPRPIMRHSIAAGSNTTYRAS